MSVRSWQPPLTAATVFLAVLVAGCGAGDGLRVESGSGAVSPTPVTTQKPSSPKSSMGIMRETPATKSKQPTETVTPFTATQPPDDRRPVSRSVALNPAQLRTLLLSSPVVDADAKAVLATCRSCVARGVATDVIGDGSEQRIVTVKVLNTGWAFVAYLVGDVDQIPTVRSVIRAQDMRITVGTDRTLVVGSKVYGPIDRSCCPSGSKVELYKWNGNYLIKTSEVFSTKGP